MKWEFCRYCRINGKCENQDRGYMCKFVKISEYYNKVNINRNYPDKVSQLKSYIKRLIEEREEVKKQIEMLQNPENAITHEMQHCEKRIDE